MKKLNLVFCLSLLIMAQGLFAAAVDLDGIDIHGYVSQGYLKSDENNYLLNSKDGSFEFTELGINFSKEFDKLRVGLQLLSRDMGEFGNNEIKLDWAMGDYHFKDYLGFRVGKVKIPVGFYNAGRDVDMLRLPVMLPAAIYDEGGRDTVNAFQGAGIYGVITPKVIGEFDYELYYGTINNPIDSIYIKGAQEKITSEFPAGTSSEINSLTTKYIAGGALRWTPLDGLRLGFTYSKSELDVNGTVTNPIFQYLFGATSTTVLMDLESIRSVGSLEYTWDDFTFAAEYVSAELTHKGVVVGMGPSPAQSVTSIGWYLQGNYQIDEKFAVGLYYSEFYADKNDKHGTTLVENYAAWQKEIVPSLRYDISDNMIVKGEVHFIDGVAQVYNFNNPDGREKDWVLYALKATYSF
ncbi:MAG: hypothetical protein GX654_08175 [Desulfatiglans sp.]|nr:hypothetical protein [Desulfatiglans sp.]